MPCYCGQSKDYSTCCQPLHQGETKALSPEQLMRSRYSAFVVMNESYLVETWHPATRPANLSLDPTQKWIGLKIRNVVSSNSDQTPNEVEFIARFKVNGKAHRLHERSRFVNENDQWFYYDGDMLE